MYSKSKPKYTEIAKANISEKRNIVISDCSTGGFTIAQQSLIKEGEKEIPMFYRGAISIRDLNGLYNLRDALNITIKKVEERLEEEKAWDDALKENN